MKQQINIIKLYFFHVSHVQARRDCSSRGTAAQGRSQAIPDYLLDQEVRDKVLLEIARKAVMKHWVIGVDLGMEYCDIVNCVPENETYAYEKRFRVLHRWKQQQGRDATNRSLINGLAGCKNKLLLDVIRDAVLGGLSPDDECRDGPTPTVTQPLLRVIPLPFLVFVSTALAFGQQWMVYWLKGVLAECERRKNENACLSHEIAKLREKCTVVEHERDEERDKSRKLSLELERFEQLGIESSIVDLIRKRNNGVFKEEPPGDSVVPENTIVSFSSSESISQLETSTQLGYFPHQSSSQHTDPPTRRSFKLITDVKSISFASVSSFDKKITRKTETVPNDNPLFSKTLPPGVDVSSEPEVLTPDVDEDQDQTEDDDSSFDDENDTSNCTPPTSNSQIQAESNLEDWLEGSINPVISVGTGRDYSSLIDEDARMEWANPPSPKRQKV